MNRHLALGLMVGCILAATLLRIPELTEIPPGLHYDEAANGILAGDIGLRGERPVFITSYTGKEPLFFYLAGGLMRALGESVFALRMTAALIGILTVAATYRLGYELLRDRCIAVIAAALLAVSFWHVLFSRLGFRAVTQPLMQALTVATLYYGLRRKSWPWIAAAGLLLGLTAYTYLAARIFPIPLLLSLLPLALARGERRLRLKQVALYFGAAFLVLLPLIIFFVGNPDTFWVRFDQVVGEESSIVDYLDSYAKTLGMFFIVGDPYWRFNIPDRPLFNWFWGGLALVGWGVSLYRTSRESKPKNRSAYLLLVLIPLFMILPSSLAINEILPSNLRAIGLMPFIYLLPAIGIFTLLLAFQSPANALYKWAAGIREWKRIPEELPEYWATKPPMLIAVIMLILLIGGIRVSWSYFNQWNSRSDLYYDSDSDLVNVAEFLEDVEFNEAEVFVASQHYRHPTLAFLSERYDQVKWLPESQVIVLPESSESLIIYPANSPKPAWAEDLFTWQSVEVGPEGPDGRPTFEAVRVNGPIVSGPSSVEVNANFNDVMTLLEYEINPGVSGSFLPITLVWKVEDVPQGNITPFIHLEDPWGYRWSQVEPFAYPSEQWSMGDTIVQRVNLPLSAGMPPGSYFLRTGLYDVDSAEQLAVIDSSGRYAGNAVMIENAKVLAGQTPDTKPRPPFVLNQKAGPNLRLVGFEREETAVPAGARLPFSLWWESSGSLNPLTSRIELIDENNKGRILANTQPVQGTYPFQEWEDFQFVIDRQSPVIPKNTPEGQYRLNLRLLDGNDETLLTADLGPLTVEESQRIFSAPGSQHPQAAIFGKEIQLLGYNIEPDGPDRYRLELVWQALQNPAKDYTVFVHLLDQDGTCCVWQDDIWPQQGSYPTSGWLAGEVVIDPYEITVPADLPPGLYPLEIGLYFPESGIRLLVEVPRMATKDALILHPLEVE